MLEKKEKRGSRKIDFEVSRLLRPVISGIISQNSCLLNLCFYYFCKHFYNQDSKYDIYTFIFIVEMNCKYNKEVWRPQKEG